jgi:hypothetical protein
VGRNSQIQIAAVAATNAVFEVSIIDSYCTRNSDDERKRSWKWNFYVYL